MRSALTALLLALPLAPALSACGDDGFFTDPTLVRDTVVIAAPTSSVDRPSALDFTNAGAGVGLRRPERLEDAQQWDIALRQTDSGLAFRTFEAAGQNLRGAGLSPRTGDFEALERAPRASSEYQTGLVPVTQGSFFTVRSRQYAGGLGFVCTAFAKIKVVEADAAAGTAKVALVANGGCDDERLTDD